MDFKIHLSPEARRKLDAQRAELARLYQLPDRWLAEALLRLARKVRSGAAELFVERDRCYETALVWNVIPEIAKRLGKLNDTAFMRGERDDWELRRLDNKALRVTVGAYIKNTSQFYLERKGSIPEDVKSAWELISHEAVNGNPIVIALDRVAPPSLPLDPDDHLANQMYAINIQRGNPTEAVWRPDPSVLPLTSHLPGVDDEDAFENVAGLKI